MESAMKKAYQIKERMLDYGQVPSDSEEGRHIKYALTQIINDAEKLRKIVDDGDDLPQWVHDKIVTAADRVDSATQYISSKIENQMIEGKDQNDDGESDFQDVRIARMLASGMSRDEIKEKYPELFEGRKRRKKPGNPGYYKGTRKSNKSMEREINKCAKKPRPKSCYDYWSADKQYDKSKKESVEKEASLEEIRTYITELVRGELTEGKLSKKTRGTLKKKAENANMPLGALTSVYRKGLAAWLTGHRQGVPQHQWAMARVNSFIRGGKTRKVDTAEWEKVKKHRAKK
jgi:hypothetical protein